MKFWPIWGKSKRLQRKTLTPRRFSTAKPQAAKLVVCLASLSLVVPGDVSCSNSQIVASASPQLLVSKINQIATEVTVKILAVDFLGSGIIIDRRGSIYTVVTNQHVLRAGEPPFRIQTADGKIHFTRIVETVESTQYDLVLLKFRAIGKKYQAATLGRASELTVGEAIFAAGFPSQEKVDSTHNREEDSQALNTPVLKTGRISIILDQALEEGYQIGYTNDVKRGMSGGPLLNSRGEVVGINGKHAYPLWDAPDFFEDGSQPCSPLQELITRSSLAIPIERILKLTPQLTLSSSLTPANTLTISVDSEEEKDSDDLISRMQAEAEARKNCRELPSKSKILRRATAERGSEMREPESPIAPLSTSTSSGLWEARE
jgi:S1-C subfamily serine protease